MNVYTRALALADLIEQAGIRATVDRRNVNPPCVLVTMPDAAYDVHAGHVTATWRLLVIVPGPPSGDTFKALWGDTGLLPLLDQVDGLNPTTATPVTYTDNTTTIEITWQETI